jgi:hypothetical protein
MASLDLESLEARSSPAAPTSISYHQAMTVAPILPLLVLVLLIVLLRVRIDPWRLACLDAGVVSAVLVVVSTELLSFWYALTHESLLVLWGAMVLALAILAWQRRTAIHHLSFRSSSPLSRTDRALLAAVLVIVVAEALVAMLAPPNTWDSMTYHMSRVAHWTQRASVEHYPTFIQRQLYMPPLAEFMILTLYLLGRGDRLANLVQWAAMMGSLVGVSLLARQFGGSPRAQVLAVVVAATIPMGILQASSTQNDSVVGLWLVSLAVAVVAQRRSLIVGAALGLALATKASAFVFAAPFVLWFAADRLARMGWRAWREFFVVTTVVLALNAAFLARNLMEYGAPLGLGREGPYEFVNDAVGVRPMLSVALRNVAGQMATPSPTLNGLIERSVAAVHWAMGLHVDDPATTLRTTRFEEPRPRAHEDLVPNGAHVGLTLLSLGVLVASPHSRRQRGLLLYVGVLLAAFLLFSALFRWQPWHGRLELPLFVLGAPIIGLVLASRPILGTVVGAVLLLAALAPLLWSESKPLLGPSNVFGRERLSQYFATRPELEAPYRQAVDRLRRLGCRDIALVMYGNDWEYPLWVLTHQVFGLAGVRIEHATGCTGPEVCALVTTIPEYHGELLAARGRLYRRDMVAPSIAVYLPY